MYYCKDDKTQKREMFLTSYMGHTMSLKWYIAVLTADGEAVEKEYNWDNSPVWQVYCEYPNCPHYLFAELTLEKSGGEFIDQQPLTMFFDFWEVDPAITTTSTDEVENGSTTNEETGEEVSALLEDDVQFYESVKVTALYPTAGGSFDFEKVEITQECGNVNDSVEEAVCPWSASANDCWSAESNMVKFTVKRRLGDHVETSPDASYYFRGGFAYQGADENGQLQETEQIGDARAFYVFSSGVYSIGLTLSAGLFTASSLLF